MNHLSKTWFLKDIFIAKHFVVMNELGKIKKVFNYTLFLEVIIFNLQLNTCLILLTQYRFNFVKKLIKKESCENHELSRNCK
jgi:hypothetical protein